MDLFPCLFLSLSFSIFFVDVAVQWLPLLMKIIIDPLFLVDSLVPIIIFIIIIFFIL